MYVRHLSEAWSKTSFMCSGAPGRNLFYMITTRHLPAAFPAVPSRIAGYHSKLKLSSTQTTLVLSGDLPFCPVMKFWGSQFPSGWHHTWLMATADLVESRVPTTTNVQFPIKNAPTTRMNAASFQQQPTMSPSRRSQTLLNDRTEVILLQTTDIAGAGTCLQYQLPDKYMCLACRRHLDGMPVMMRSIPTMWHEHVPKDGLGNKYICQQPWISDGPRIKTKMQRAVAINIDCFIKTMRPTASPLPDRDSISLWEFVTKIPVSIISVILV